MRAVFFLNRSQPSRGLAGAYALYTVAAVISIFLVRSFINETKGEELEEMTG